MGTHFTAITGCSFMSWTRLHHNAITVKCAVTWLTRPEIALVEEIGRVYFLVNPLHGDIPWIWPWCIILCKTFISNMHLNMEMILFSFHKSHYLIKQKALSRKIAYWNLVIRYNSDWVNGGYLMPRLHYSRYITAGHDKPMSGGMSSTQLAKSQSLTTWFHVPPAPAPTTWRWRPLLPRGAVG